MTEPRVRVRESPSDQVVKDSAKAVEITDARGRKITLTRPPILTQFKLPLIVGSDAAKNEVYMGMVMPLTYVSAIDGDPLAFPTTHLQIDALINRLDEDGVAAVMLGVVEHFGNVKPEEERAQVKNSPPDQN